MSEDKPKRKHVTSFLLSDEEKSMLNRQYSLEDRSKGAIMRDALTMYCIVEGAYLDLGFIGRDSL